MKQILNNILVEIKPSKKEEKEVLNKVGSILKKLKKIDAKIILGGSGAKDTWLKNSYDADVFVLFDYKKYKDRSDELSNILEKQLKKIFPKAKRLHGSRDYFQINLGNFTVEIVPILDIKKSEQAVNITDVSPLHSKWVNRYGFKDDIRLTKQFCKGTNVYGAESYIMGFSGYICEIMTIYYKGFQNLIKNAAKWKDKAVIDTENYYKNKQEALMTINKSKQTGPMIIVDPVQRTRNAAAALSKEKFDVFVKKCREFLKKPSKDYFVIKKIEKKYLFNKNKKYKLVVIDLKVSDGKTDIVGCKIIKDLDKLIKQLIKQEFKVKTYGYEWDKKSDAFYYIYLDKEELPKEKIMQGPSLKLREHVKNFKKFHKNTFIKNDKISARDKRRYRKPENLIKDYKFNSKIKKIEVR